MGKKKSVVLITLITIVLVVLCALVAFPKITVPGSGGIKKWNPVALQYDLGSEFGGGHYAYYYPNGVITETEYKNNLEAFEDETEKNEYASSYVRHGNTGLYLSTDEDDCILTDEGVVSEPFKTAFNKAVDVISARFAERAQNTGSSYCVSVVDDYAIRVEISSGEDTDDLTSKSYAQQAFVQLANLNVLSFEITTSDGSTLVEQLKEDGASVKDLVKSVTVDTQYKVAYLKLTFTKAGKAMLKTFKTTEGATSLDLKMGDAVLMQITSESINTKNEVMMGVRMDSDILYAHTVCTLINSAMEEGAVNINDNDTTPFVLQTPTDSEIRSFEPVFGDVLIWVYVAILAAIVAASVLTIWKMGGFGIMNLYTTLSYFVISAICFAFISKGVFVVSLGTVFVFLAGLAIVNVLHVAIYNAIKAEVALGKTVQSSIKGGYKKTIWTVIDVYAVLLLGAIAMLIGVASLNTVACQALICIIAGAFCNLVWGRVINFLLVSASKDKYKYFRLVREDDGDDE